MYEGIKLLIGDDIADTVLYVANTPGNVQIAEVLILSTHQANGSIIKCSTGENNALEDASLKNKE